jgi:CDP-6-deoxy-D-xylo-4-hexulose-3-dehydrase
MIRLAEDTIDRSDINNLVDWLNQEPIPRLTKFELVQEFEKKFAKYLGVKYAVFCNSGSSAVYLSILSLRTQYKLKNNKVALCAVCWLTDLSSILLNDSKPILIDCNLDNFSVDLKQLEYCFENERPSIYLHVHPLGLPNNIFELKKLCSKYDVLLIEDSCESLGTAYKKKLFGTFGDLSIFSFYYGHHMSTLEGGMICTNSQELYNKCLMLRSHGWARDLEKQHQAELQNQFNISDFDNLYTMYDLGLNFRSTDLQAFIGLNQLKKLNSFIDNRKLIFEEYQKHFWSVPWG